MISFPAAKINLGLSIISKRADGFHNLETIFYRLPLRDLLEIVPSESGSLHCTGLEITGPEAENLVQRAWYLLKNKFPQITPLAIYLHKLIPMAAGLGGGSSDAAEMLRMMNKHFKLAIPDKQLKSFALQIGSDCPFFMQQGVCFATGRGEILEPLILDLSGYSFLLIHSQIRIGTAWAFSKIHPAETTYDMREIIKNPLNTWSHRLENQFETPVFAAYPELRDIKEDLYRAGALYVSMTGSGSTIYGIFRKKEVPSIEVKNATKTLIN